MRALLTALSAIGIAQVIKLPLYKLKTGRWNINRLLETGGMPSSHSAGVTALATFVAFKKGLRSIDFAISSMLGLIVMYDAMGIRRHAGEIAIEVNELDKEVEQIANIQPGHFHEQRHKKLKELLGHQPSEVLGGSILGFFVAMTSYFMKPNTQKK